MPNFKLDKADHTLLWLLDTNSRQSLTNLAKKIRKTPQEAKRRFDRLVDEGVIRYCWPMVEYRAVGHFFVLYLVKLHNMNITQEQEFFRFLNSVNEIPIIMRGDGYFDVLIGICAKGMFRAENIFQEINAKFSQHFMWFEAVIPIGFSQFRRNYLVGKQGVTEGVAFTGKDVGSLPLKQETLRALEVLNRNCRVSVQEIADSLKIGYDNAKGQVKRLEHLGVVQSYSYLLDHQKVGFPRHRVLLQLRNLTSMRERKFFDFCNFHPNIIHYLRLLGAWQLILDVEVESRTVLRTVLREIKSNFSDLVFRIEPTEIYDIDRFRDIPERLF